MSGFKGFLAGGLILAAAAWALAIEVGEKAPEIDVTSWIVGEPVLLEQCAGKKVVVVEFFGAWCEPCKKAIPLLSKLAEKYKAEVEIVGVSTEKPEELKELTKDGKVKYHLACDGDNNTTAPYMQSIRTRHRKHLPYAFVIDKAGGIVWQGDATAGLERALEKVLAGKLDAEKAKALEELQKTVADSVSSNDLDQAATDSDKLLESDPGNEVGLDAKLRLFFRDKDAAKLKAFIDGVLPKIDDDRVALNVIAWKLVTAENVAMRQPSTALKAARRAVALSESKDAAILDTLARVYQVIGMADEALDTQRAAVAADSEDEEIKKTLAYYEACAEARKQAKAPAAPPPSDK